MLHSSLTDQANWRWWNWV